ncbi:MAG: GNAT family N-acetyltransferase [Pseudomonadota bacterium]
MTVAIRVAHEGDQGRCVELFNQLQSVALDSAPPTNFAEAFALFLTGARGELLVAEEEGLVLGMASVSYNIGLRYGGEYCQLEELVVAPEARGKNVGGLLVRETISRARARGCGEYGLYLVEHTEHNKPFYEKYGFVAVGTEMRQVLD